MGKNKIKQALIHQSLQKRLNLYAQGCKVQHPTCESVLKKAFDSFILKTEDQLKA
jgi:hypothetical protein